ncbi:hypothetical protein CDL12_27988 [Handroanthus impetiginosus]|uniref:Knottins-like domain-containing protein n=1 Tax=Handroanthus impetiginosus TaxID=429701 RepID=A0A2G9G2U5_9LAMI|nr:hypothetical protein CDL12_27988 [Handroanthus impetiginosus]
MMSEATICEAPSTLFTGLCFSDRNCGTICEKEGFLNGYCKFLKCTCSKDCNVGGGGGSPGQGAPRNGPPEGGPPGGEEPPVEGPPGGKEPPAEGPPILFSVFCPYLLYNFFCNFFVTSFHFLYIGTAINFV